MTSNKEELSDDINWADYFDSLVHESWVESQKLSSIYPKGLPVNGREAISRSMNLNQSVSSLNDGPSVEIK